MLASLGMLAPLAPLRSSHICSLSLKKVLSTFFESKPQTVFWHFWCAVRFFIRGLVYSCHFFLPSYCSFFPVHRSIQWRYCTQCDQVHFLVQKFKFIKLLPHQKSIWNLVPKLTKIGEKMRNFQFFFNCNFNLKI